MAKKKHEEVQAAILSSMGLSTNASVVDAALTLLDRGGGHELAVLLLFGVRNVTNDPFCILRGADSIIFKALKSGSSLKAITLLAENHRWDSEPSPDSRQLSFEVYKGEYLVVPSNATTKILKLLLISQAV